MKDEHRQATDALRALRRQIQETARRRKLVYFFAAQAPGEETITMISNAEPDEAIEYLEQVLAGLKRGEAEFEAKADGGDE